MFKLEKETATLFIVLPDGLSNDELIGIAKKHLTNSFKNDLHGLDIKINGRITVPLAFFLSHELAHITHSIRMYDPKTREYVLCVCH